jgi:hypothetical protein
MHSTGTTLLMSGDEIRITKYTKGIVSRDWALGQGCKWVHWVDKKVKGISGCHCFFNLIAFSHRKG